jgi:hypothetical protein
VSALAQRHLAFVGLALVLATAAACSGSKSPDASSAAASPAAADSAAAAGSTDAAADSGAPAALIDPCKKLALADVQAFFSAPLSAKHDDDIIGSAGGCIYHTADDHTNVEIVAVTGPHAESFFEGNAKRYGTATIPLSGIGDKAFRPAGDVWVYAMKNGVFCMVDSSTSHARASLKGAEQYSDAAIPDAIAGTIAERLATLCDKLWQ